MTDFIATPSVKDVRGWALRNNITVNGKPVGERGRLHPDVWVQYAAAHGGVALPTAPSNEAVTASTTDATDRTPTMPKLGAGQGRWIRVEKLKVKDYYLSSLDRERHVTDIKIDGDRITVIMTGDDLIHTVKFYRGEMVRVL